MMVDWVFLLEYLLILAAIVNYVMKKKKVQITSSAPLGQHRLGEATKSAALSTSPPLTTKADVATSKGTSSDSWVSKTPTAKSSSPSPSPSPSSPLSSTSPTAKFELISPTPSPRLEKEKEDSESEEKTVESEASREQTEELSPPTSPSLDSPIQSSPSPTATNSGRAAPEIPPIELQDVQSPSSSGWVKKTPVSSARRLNLLEKETPSKPTLKIEYGHAELQGKRPTMEDAHVTFCSDDNTLSERALSLGVHGLWGIFDGHKGNKAALFAAEHLHQALFAELERPHELISDAITKSFIATDERLVADELANNYSDGSTAVVAFIQHSETDEGPSSSGEKLYVANIGDAEAVLVKADDRFVVPTVRHKPTAPAELARIKAAGGHVIMGRLSGLSVSRSFGDKELKIPSYDPEDDISIGKLMSEEPDIFSTTLKKEEDLALILGCDGVWEKNFTHAESVQFVLDLLKDPSKSATDIAEALVKEALSRGSTDNISAIILLFRWN